MRKIDLLVVHCSASDDPTQDSIEAIKDLHVQPSQVGVRWGNYLTHCKGWDDIGYHYVITQDGVIHPGRNLWTPGAHCKGFNARSLGVCLTGDKRFTPEQFASLKELCNYLMAIFNLERKDILHHRDLNSHKTCPNFTLNEIY